MGGCDVLSGSRAGMAGKAGELPLPTVGQAPMVVGLGKAKTVVSPCTAWCQHAK